MKRDCNIDNPLIRDGVSQSGRLLPALKKDYVKVDERTVSDLLGFIYRYSQTLQYYNEKNQPDGDWQAFVENDISTLVALVSQKDLSSVRDCFNAALEIIEDGSSQKTDIKSAFKVLFNLIFSLASDINRWYERPVPELSLNTEIQRIIKAQLNYHFQNAVAYYKCAKHKGLVSVVTSVFVSRCGQLPPDADDILAGSFDTVWIVRDYQGQQQWETYFSSISEDCSIFGSDGESDTVRIRKGLDEIVTIYESFYKSTTELIHQSPGFFQETLDKWSSHEPHAALLLTFLQLMEYARNELNAITERHLDFFYRQILSFAERDEVPDRVNILFELAKQVKSYLVKKGTLLKGGKDSKGIDVLYKTDSDIVVNRAKVEQLKTVFVDRRDNYRIYSAPAANSRDGQGSPFEVDEPKWKTFGQSQRTEQGTFKPQEQMTMTFSEIGFAVASPILFLSEGLRKIIIRFISSGNIFQGVDASQFRVLLSGKEEWIEVDSAQIDLSQANTITITLDPSAPSVTAFDSKILGENYKTDYPIVKILLNNRPDSTSTYAYKNLKNRIFSKIELEVKVGNLSDKTQGAANLIVQNDLGIINPLKPFQPFGPAPVIGSTLYIGSSEIFQKKLASLTAAFSWQDVPDQNLGNYYQNLKSSLTNSSFQAKYYILLDRQWRPLSQKNLFNTANAKNDNVVTFTGEFNSLPGYKSSVIDEPIEDYKVGLERGFIKLELTEPDIAFGHRIYRDAYTKNIIKFARNPQDTTVKIPNEPYTPVISRLNLLYEAKDTVDLYSKTSVSKFFHIYPFGHDEPGIQSDSGPLHVVCQFEYPSHDDPVKNQNEGELYIGISELEPRQSLYLFFQVAEGSADPELSRPDVHWSYFGNNKWIPFEDKEIISDSTNGLIKSGIITFDIPEAATRDNNTLLSSGYHWLRASVHSNSAAISDMIDIKAQAVQASFVNNDNDSNFLADSLPQGSISKMAVKDAAIKKVIQPYSSFGGKVKEQGAQFHTRVSERLRHKRRGISIWDYERLVLEKFPDIYKVKCINHSTYSFAQDGLEISRSEFAPGFVTLIVVPDLKNKNAVDPLEPRVSLSRLEEIKKYLGTLISPFAQKKLQVLNPLYEQIQVEFAVVFHSGNDWGFYKTQLNNDIKEFLSPWISEKGGDIVFGGKLHKSVILNFVEERPYVDFVTDFRMNHIIAGASVQSSRYDIDEAVPTSARSIFVSSKEHNINAVKAESCL